jgi:hypothetical protein
MRAEPTRRQQDVAVTRRRRRRTDRASTPPPRFWGRIGDYDAVTRDGMLLLLAPDRVHPSRRVTTPA